MPKIEVNLNELVQIVLDTLDARSRDVVSRRYGLTNGNPETLEAIGQDYGITRERVRQIQSYAKKNLLQQKDKLAPIIDLLDEIFTEQGGILEEDHAVTCVVDSVDNAVENPRETSLFYLDILPPYKRVAHDKSFDIHWQHPEKINPQAKDIVEAAGEILKKSGTPISEEAIIEKIKESLQESDVELSNKVIVAALTASRAITTTPFGDWGLVGWPETTPKGVGDKAFAVMRRHNKPAHFREIAELISDAKFDAKQANAQTVHNELIKDKRFVLVGRGTYALSEWGFISGTVADVIEDILKKAEKPLTREEVISQVLDQRQVKKNTIVLSLHNPSRFARTADNTYTVA